MEFIEICEVSRRVRLSQWTDVCRSGGRSVTQGWRLAGARQYSTVSHITTHCSVSSELPAFIVAYTVRHKKRDSQHMTVSLSNLNRFLRFRGHSVFGLSVCPYVRPCVRAWYQQSVSTISDKSLGEFHQIHSLYATGHKDELIRFWGQKVKSQRSRSQWNQNGEKSLVQKCTFPANGYRSII